MNYLNQIRQLFDKLTQKQKISLGVAVVALIGGIFWLTKWQNERSFKPLFQKLSQEDAGMVVQRLRESNVVYRLEDDGGTIKVPSEKVDELRLQMAVDGLPKTGRLGFEIFDKTNFGASEFSEQVNYHRAIEGELERTIMSMQEVEAARVHVTFGKSSIFVDKREPSKASILLRLKPGKVLGKANIQAIAHLAANAVEGLKPEDISIVDDHGNLMSTLKKDGVETAEVPAEILQYKANIEKDLLDKVRQTLEPLLGPDRFRASVSVDCDLASGDQSEESFDPSRSVMAVAQRSEEANSATAPAGIPGTPTNLPRPMARPGAAGTAGVMRRMENTTFQTSRVVRHTHFPQGQVKRLSVSVLLDQEIKTVGTGSTAKKQAIAPTPEKLKAIRDVVSAAVGFQQDRGDQISVEALPFGASLLEIEKPIEVPKPKVQLPNWIPDWLRLPLEENLQWLVAQKWLPLLILVLVIAILTGTFFLLRKVLRKVGSILKAIFSKIKLPKFGKKKKGAAEVDGSLQLNGAASERALAAGKDGEEGEAKEGKIGDAVSQAELLRRELTESSLDREKRTLDAIASLRPQEVEVSRLEVLNRFLTAETERDPQLVAQVIRAWMEQGK